MGEVLESNLSVGAPLAFFFVAAVVFYALPEGWQDWLKRWRGVVAAACLLTVALVAIAFGVAILTTHDHLGAATPKDAYITGPSLIVLGHVSSGAAGIPTPSPPRLHRHGCDAGA